MVIDKGTNGFSNSTHGGGNGGKVPLSGAERFAGANRVKREVARKEAARMVVVEKWGRLEDLRVRWVVCFLWFFFSSSLFFFWGFVIFVIGGFVGVCVEGWSCGVREMVHCWAGEG